MKDAETALETICRACVDSAAKLAAEMQATHPLKHLAARVKLLDDLMTLAQKARDLRSAVMVVRNDGEPVRVPAAVPFAVYAPKEPSE